MELPGDQENCSNYMSFELQEFLSIYLQLKGTEILIRITWKFELYEFELHDLNCIYTIIIYSYLKRDMCVRLRQLSPIFPHLRKDVLPRWTLFQFHSYEN